MKTRGFIAALCAAVVALALAIGAGDPAAASRTTATGKAAQAQCYSPGTRIKRPTSATIYLIDPQSYWDAIPSETVYFNLFASWSGIVVTSDFSCFRDGGTLADAHLAQKAGDSSVYIWDATYGYYRGITSEQVFNRYHFDWAKVRIQSTPVTPVLTSIPWN